MSKGAQCTTEKGMGLGCLGPGGLEGQSHGTQATASRARDAFHYETPAGPRVTTWLLIHSLATPDQNPSGHPRGLCSVSE